MDPKDAKIVATFPPELQAELKLLYEAEKKRHTEVMAYLKDYLRSEKARLSKDNKEIQNDGEESK